MIYADEPPPPPMPWHRDLGDGLIFHYRPEYAHYSPHDFSRGTPTEFIAQGYPQTGLYRDGELVYIVDVPLFHRLYFSSDGMSFIKIDFWVPLGIIERPDLSFPTVHFFKEGNLVHYYSLFELVSDPYSLFITVSHAQWDYQNQRYHDRESNTLMVRTRDGNDITFDLTTGLILSSYSHSYSDSDAATQSIATQSLIRIRTIVTVLAIILLAIR